MAKFVYIFRGGAVTEPGISPTDSGAHLAKWTAWFGELSKAGHAQPGGARLDRPGKTLRGKQKTLTDGPYAETKDLVTGSIVVEAASLDEATRLAEGCPVFEYDGSVEVRPTLSTERA